MHLNRSLVDQILSPLDASTRSRVVVSLAEVFCDPDAQLTPKETRFYDELVSSQSQHESTRVRAILSGRLAHVDTGPVRTVCSLAYDPSLAVAGPVLRHSPLLRDGHLCDVVRIRGEGHLCAVAQRLSLSELVTEALIGRAMWSVLRAVSANDTASLSRRSIARLVEAARADGQITTAMLKRKDLPVPLSSMLVVRLRERPLAEQILLKGEDSGFSLSELLAIEPLQQPPGGAAAGSPFTPELALAEARVEALGRSGSLGEADAIWCLDGGRWKDALVVIARMSRQPTELVVQTFESSEASYSLALMRLAGLSWYTAEKVLRYQAGGADLNGCIALQRGDFERLSPTNAERMLKMAQFRKRVRVIGGSAGSGTNK